MVRAGTGADMHGVAATAGAVLAAGTAGAGMAMAAGTADITAGTVAIAAGRVAIAAGKVDIMVAAAITAGCAVAVMAAATTVGCAVAVMVAVMVVDTAVAMVAATAGVTEPDRTAETSGYGLIAGTMAQPKLEMSRGLRAARFFYADRSHVRELSPNRCDSITCSDTLSSREREAASPENAIC